MEAIEIAAVVILFWAVFTALPVMFYILDREEGKRITWSELVFIGILCFPGLALFVISDTGGAIVIQVAHGIWNLFDKPIRRKPQ